MEILNRLFNWKKYPASVFFIAGPLAFLGFGAILLRGVLEFVWHGDPWYLVIALAGVALLGLALWPLRRVLRSQP